MSGLQDAVLVSVDNLESSFLTIGRIEVTLQPNATWTRKIVVEGDGYQLNNIDLKIFVLDREVASPTNGYWMPADAVVAYGWKDDGSLIVINQHTTALKLLITAKAFRNGMGRPVEV